jgi:hypothetical protein
VGASNAWVIVTSNSHNCFNLMQIYVLNDVRMHAYYSLSALVFVLVHRCPVYLSHSITFVHFFQAWWSPPTPQRWSWRFCKSGQQAAGWCE